MLEVNSIVQNRQRAIIRLFVSSTFSDFRLERDALQRYAFPELERRCDERGFQFHGIDLRWGVSTEAGLDHRTMGICLSELQRSQMVSPQPNFLILMGNRYGWRPLPEAITEIEFNHLVSTARTGGPGGGEVAGVEDKSAERVVREWYRRDHNVLDFSSVSDLDNEKTLSFILQPRTQTLEDGRDYTQTNQRPPTDTQDWLHAQDALWRVIRLAFPDDRMENRFDDLDRAPRPLDLQASPGRQFPTVFFPQIVRFRGSATEQEIWSGALLRPTAEQHVTAVFRDIKNQDTFSDQTLTDYFDLNDAGAIDRHAQQLQKQLMNAVKRRLGADRIIRYSDASLTERDGRLVVNFDNDWAVTFAKRIVDMYWPIMEEQINSWWNPATSGSLAATRTSHDQQARIDREQEIEREEHLRIAKEHVVNFIGRDEPNGPLDRIGRYLTDDNRHPLVVHGSSGSGKSALMARAFQDIAPGRFHIVRFLGTTPTSSALRSLLTNLCLEFRGVQPMPTMLPTDIRELQQELLQHLASASQSGHSVILFLDGLDQLSDAEAGLRLDWLLGDRDAPLLPKIKIVVSCLSEVPDDDPGGQPFAMLSEHGLIGNESILIRPLSIDQAGKLFFEHWMRDAGRTLEGNADYQLQQRDVIATQIGFSEKCREPLYLKALFDEVRFWRSYSPPPDKLPSSVEGLLEHMVKRLSREENHGALLVERALGYVSAARRGLSEKEILEVLFFDESDERDAPSYKSHLLAECERNRHFLPTNPRRIPIVIWSRLYSDVVPYLTERTAPGTEVITWHHGQIARWAKDRFVNQANWNPNNKLAAYFESQRQDISFAVSDRSHLSGSSTGECFVSPAARRVVDELPWHLKKANAWSELTALLIDLPFFSALFNVNMDEATSYWATIEQHLGPTAVEAYSRECGDNTDYSKAWNIAKVFSVLGYIDDAIDWQEKVLRSVGSSGTSIQQAAVLNNLATLLVSRNELDRAREFAAKAREHYQRIYEETGTIYDGFCDALGTLGQLYRGELRFHEAINAHLQQKDIARALGDARRESSAITGLVAAKLGLGLLDESLSQIRVGVQLCEQCGNEEGKLVLLQNQAAILIDQGRLDQGLEAVDQLAVMARKLGTKQEVIHSHGLRATIMEKQGLYEDALRELAVMERLATDSGDRSSLVICRSQKAFTFLGQGRLQEAFDVITEVHPMCASRKQLQKVEFVLVKLCEDAERTGQLALTRQCYVTLADVAAQLDRPQLRAQCLYHQSRLLFVDQRYAEAVPILEEGESFCAANELQLERSEIAVSLGVAHHGLGDLTKAKGLFERAEQLCESCGNYFGLVTCLAYKFGLLKASGAPRVELVAVRDRCRDLVRQHGLHALNAFLSERLS